MLRNLGCTAFCLLLMLGRLVCSADPFLVSVGARTHALSTGQIELGWIPSPDVIDGYQIAWGIASGQCTNLLVFGGVTNVVVGGLDPEVTYFFTAAAYDWAGGRSDSTPELSYQIMGPVNAPTNDLSKTGIYRLIGLGVM